ncbi:MAG: hypothetical protein H6718_33195 [Polyangiaceae bacterium]|nr:hypothetical protein [Polyangiaceae bacterium]
MRLRLLLGGLGMGVLLATAGCSDEDTKQDPKRGKGAGATGGTGGSGASAGNGGTGAMAGNGGVGGSGGISGAGGTTTGGASGSSGSSSGGGAGTTSGGAGGATGGSAGTTGGSAGTTGGSAGTTGGSGGACPAGFGDCDSNPLDCETDLSLVTSCGACNKTCNGANGSVECQSGTCVITGCDTNYGDCDGDDSNGCEQNLVSNDQHCGVCGRDCAAAGSTCSTNMCAPVTVQSALPISTDNSNGATWAFGNGALYQVGYYSYTVRKVPLDGSAFSNIWSAATNHAGRRSLVVNSNEVIWTQRGTPSVVLKKAHTAAQSDLPQIVFTPQYQPYFLQQKGNAYYWFSGDYQAGDPGGWIYTRSVTAPSSDPGTRIMSVDQGTHNAVFAFVVSDNALYWYTTQSTPGEIRTTPLAGGTPTVVPTGIIASGYANDRVRLFPVGNDLYYQRAEGTSFANGIYRWTPGDTGTGTQIVTRDNVSDFVVDGTSVYFIVLNANAVYKAPLTGAAPVQIANTGGVRILHQDADSIYLQKGSGTTDIVRVLK